jgi:hypothetical protein
MCSAYYSYQTFQELQIQNDLSRLKITTFKKKNEIFREAYERKPLVFYLIALT